MPVPPRELPHAPTAPLNTTAETSETRKARSPRLDSIMGTFSGLQRMEHLMKRAALVLATVCLALAAPSDAGAHHSFAETYFENKVQRIEGELVQFLYRSPHSFLHLAVTDDAGTVQRW